MDFLFLYHQQAVHMSAPRPCVNTYFMRNLYFNGGISMNMPQNFSNSHSHDEYLIFIMMNI